MWAWYVRRTLHRVDARNPKVARLHLRRLRAVRFTTKACTYAALHTFEKYVIARLTEFSTWKDPQTGPMS